MNKFIKISSGILLGAISVSGYATGYNCPSADQLISGYCDMTPQSGGGTLVSCPTVKGLQPLTGVLWMGVKPNTYAYVQSSFTTDNEVTPQAQCSYKAIDGSYPQPFFLVALYNSPATTVTGDSSLWTQGGSWKVCSTSASACTMNVTTAAKK